MIARLLRRRADQTLRVDLDLAREDIDRLQHRCDSVTRRWARAVATGRSQQHRADRLERELADANDKAAMYRTRWLRAENERSEAQAEADRLAAQLMRRGIRPESTRPEEVSV